MTIDVLPDVPLLAIFDFYVAETPKAWYRLVHVCRTWRSIVFGSQCRLNLRVYCTGSTPVKETLDIWPLLPIVITVDNYHQMRSVYNINSALEHKDRIRELILQPVTSWQLRKFFQLAAVRQPFPVLTHLKVRDLGDGPPMDVPASFLGGSAPLLQTLWLDLVPFPGLPGFLLSATHLVDLRLWKIPHSGYISPWALATSLALLTSLKTLHIGFESLNSSRIVRPYQKIQGPFSRMLILPVLTELLFKGADEYLEELVARIDAPLLNTLHITFFKLDRLIFDTLQLMQFISRTLKFKAHDKAHVVFSDAEASVILQLFDRELKLGVSPRRLSSLAQLCKSPCCQTFIPAVERLYITQSKLPKQFDVQSSQWLDLLHSFTAVKNLYISFDFVPFVARALQEIVGERVTEVLPALQTLFLEETPPSRPVLGQFVTARRLANLPVAVYRWERSGMSLTSDRHSIQFVFGIIYYLLLLIFDICVE